MDRIKRHLLLMSLLVNLSAFGQTIISGTVKEENGNSVEFANVSLKATSDGSTTDSLGRFSFSTAEKGSKILVTTHLGYKDHEQPVTLAGPAVSTDIVLKPDAKHLGEVVVSAGAFEASDKARGASLTPMDAVTVAGSGADLANALRALPGTQQIGEQAGLFVRGGTSEEAKQFIDGMLLKSPNFSSVPGILQPARVNPFLFKGILFSSGGYSALYGQALSSALILHSVDLPDKTSASISFFPPHQSVGFQQLSEDKKSSYGINLGYTHYAFLYNAIVPQEPDYFHDPEYAIADANFRIKTGKTGMLKFYTNANYNNIGMRNPDIDSASLKASFQNKGKNIYTNLSYSGFLNDNWKADIGAAFNYDHLDVYNQLLNSNNEPVITDEYPHHKNRTSRSRSDFAQGRIVFSRFFSGHQVLNFGAETFYTRDRYFINDTLSTLEDNLSAVFAEADIYLTENMAARIGGRFEFSSLLHASTVAPRASLAYRFNEGGQLNFAYGIFYQKADNPYLLQNKALDFTKATHYIINYQRKSENKLFRMEAYYKLYDNLVTTIPAFASNGEGYARGVELFLRDKKTFKNLDYWVAYTLLDTKRKFLDYPSSLNPSFSTPHTFSVATKRFFPDLNLSVNASYFFSTGRPYYYIDHDNGTEQRILDSGTTRTYNSLNLHVAYLTSFFKKWKLPDFSGIAFGGNNLLGTRQVFGYNYSHDGSNKVPITLPARRTYFIGIFMSFGIDRRDDMMNEKTF